MRVNEQRVSSLPEIEAIESVADGSSRLLELNTNHRMLGKPDNSREYSVCVCVCVCVQNLCFSNTPQSEI